LSKFKDADGKEWEVRVTVGHLRPLRELGMDLKEFVKEGAEAGLADLLFGDPERFGQIMWVLCGAQAEKVGLTPEDFACRLDGESLDRAAVALVEGVVGFFRPGTGAKVAAVVRRGMDKATARAVEKMGSLTDADIDRLLDSPTSKNGASNSAA
jgi:hypothetical protein